MEGWDISQQSLHLTSESIKKLGVDTTLALHQRDILSDEDYDGAFDGIVISEVLEHIEDPAKGITNIKKFLKPGGFIFINVPCNSPAPDHIHLFSHPDEVRSLVEEQGLDVIAFESLPMTGYTLDRAIKAKATISCWAIAQEP